MENSPIERGLNRQVVSSWADSVVEGKEEEYIAGQNEEGYKMYEERERLLANLEKEEFLENFPDGGIPAKVRRNVEENFKDDKDVIVAFIRSGHTEILSSSSGRIKGDPEVCSLALEINPKSFEYMSDSIKMDEEFSREAIKRFPRNYKYTFNEAVKKDMNVIEGVIEIEPSLVNLIPGDVVRKENFWSKMMGINIEVLHYIEDYNIIIKKMFEDIALIKYTPEFLLTNKIYWAQIIKHYGDDRVREAIQTLGVWERDRVLSIFR